MRNPDPKIMKTMGHRFCKLCCPLGRRKRSIMPILSSDMRCQGELKDPGLVAFSRLKRGSCFPVCQVSDYNVIGMIEVCRLTRSASWVFHPSEWDYERYKSRPGSQHLKSCQISTIQVQWPTYLNMAATVDDLMSMFSPQPLDTDTNTTLSRKKWTEDFFPFQRQDVTI